MTIKVYEVTRDGLTRIVREEAEVVPLARPEASHQFPTCECPLSKAPARWRRAMPMAGPTPFRSGARPAPTAPSKASR